ncbi:TRAP transporter large permease [Falsigemmobacter intermedius]|uniref:TRAP transporter large permease protein n=1 Tax=Falsigemmobacter intermedius TaxID=1553448 RepID=A0A444MC92_9RHOB|nr:TRAP transporter large permease subunit [Falsigemmobacter intermedius]RWY41628.1 TRAP transporter large permease subunit [Falsigemmobacter intermedius]
MLEIGLLTLFLFAAFLMSSIWVGLSLFGVGYLLLAVFKPNLPLVSYTGKLLWNAVSAQELLALPLFILMSDVLVSAHLGRSLFSGLAPWVSRLPGGLMHVNVAGSTLFAAVSGSSAATTAIVGRVTLPELEARGYPRRLAVGSLAGAGTLGFLIPPSIIMIIYGVAAQQSILELFMAGVIPGLLLATIFFCYIAVAHVVSGGVTDDKVYTWGDRMRGLVELGPVVALVGGIMSALYLGLASPTELAAVGVAGAMILSAVRGHLSFTALAAAGRSAVATSAMMGLIMAGAALLNASLGFLGLPKAIAGQIVLLELSPLMLIAFLLLFYVLIGMFLDGTSIIVMTLPITLPLVIAAGFDPIWFGIFIVIAVEIAQITPPVGFNLFVIQSQTGHTIGYLFLAVLPFFLIMLAYAMLLAIFPEIVLWLPSRM